MSERWHSVEEVAVHLGVAQDTVRRWIDTRALPAHRLGKLWKFSLAEVDAWVRAGSHQDGMAGAGAGAPNAESRA